MQIHSVLPNSEKNIDCVSADAYQSLHFGTSGRFVPNSCHLCAITSHIREGNHNDEPIERWEDENIILRDLSGDRMFHALFFSDSRSTHEARLFRSLRLCSYSCKALRQLQFVLVTDALFQASDILPQERLWHASPWMDGWNAPRFGFRAVCLIIRPAIALTEQELLLIMMFGLRKSWNPPRTVLLC